MAIFGIENFRPKTYLSVNDKEGNQAFASGRAFQLSFPAF